MLYALTRWMSRFQPVFSSPCPCRLRLRLLTSYCNSRNCSQAAPLFGAQFGLDLVDEVDERLQFIRFLQECLGQFVMMAFHHRGIIVAAGENYGDAGRKFAQSGQAWLLGKTQSLYHGACQSDLSWAAALVRFIARITNKMKMTRNLLGRGLALSSLFGLAFAALNLLVAHTLVAADAPKDNAGGGGDGSVPLALKLPAPAFKGTPKDMQIGPNVEPISEKPRPPMMVPPGLKNLASGSKVTCSDKNVTGENLGKLTDGDKEASDQSIIFIRKGAQWVQMDLGSPQEIFAVAIWHAHNSAKVYHSVIVQVADDADFIENVRTIFNNDQNNVSGLGVGTDREYFETYEGKLINAKGAKARYIRFYSKGSTESALNEYTELEVFGRPVK